MASVLKIRTIQTPVQGFIGITHEVQYAVNEVADEQHFDLATFNGAVTVFCPHTTAAVTVNENADPDVQQDFLLSLDRAYPYYPETKHDNAPAHIKSALIGCSQTVPVQNGKLILGKMQSVYFCEFDGPRTRKFYIQVLW